MKKQQRTSTKPKGFFSSKKSTKLEGFKQNNEKGKDKNCTNKIEIKVGTFLTMLEK